MRILTRVAIFLALLAGIESLTRHACLAQDSKETATVTGRVLVDGKPAPGVIVMATPSVSDPAKVLELMLKPSTAIKAATDSDGRYRFEAMPPGKYNIAPAAPALVAEPGASTKELNITEASTVEGIDFSLARGGVITGRLTDGEGYPIIGEEISLKQMESAKPGGGSQFGGEGRMYFTDDRGVYRVFALSPGRYIVSAGTSRDPMISLIAKRPRRVRTFYPGVTEEAKATPVEVIAGGEASGIDIKVRMADKGFAVSGRVLTAETGATVPNVIISYRSRGGAHNPDQDPSDASFAFPGGMTTTNAKGEFRIESLSPGGYSVNVESVGGLTGRTEFYADPVNLDVQSVNIDKLEIKVHLGASISGFVVIETPDASSALESLATLVLVAMPDSRDSSSSPGMSKLAADGSFRIGGLKPGITNLRSLAYGPQRFSVLRVERNGAELPNGIDVQPDEQITGVRVVVVRANCIINGHVTIKGGILPPEYEISVWARQLNNNINDGHLNSNMNDSNRSFGVDAKGNFVIENLAPGDYEVEVSVNEQGPLIPRRLTAKQLVSVTPGTPAQASLVLDLTVKGPDK